MIYLGGASGRDVDLPALPLTDEAGEPLAEGELVVARDGVILERIPAA